MGSSVEDGCRGV